MSNYMESFIQKPTGIIIVRHIRDYPSFFAWSSCYHSIRKCMHDISIVVIDDHSDKDFINPAFEDSLTNTVIIENDTNGRGEMLAYYYLLKYKFFTRTAILHDSIVVNKPIDFDQVNDCSFFWGFDGKKWDRTVTPYIDTLEFETLKEVHNSVNWLGCFGCMSLITLNFLEKLDDKYQLKQYATSAQTRMDRCIQERVFALMVASITNVSCIHGIIHDWQTWNTAPHQASIFQHLPLVKTWLGR